jgi:hypothetical protein
MPVIFCGELAPKAVVTHSVIHGWDQGHAYRDCKDQRGLRLSPQAPRERLAGVSVGLGSLLPWTRWQVGRLAKGFERALVPGVDLR